MSHLNIYMNDNLLEKVKVSAKLEKVSISKFICNRLAASIDNSSQWPDGYFDLFGSLSDSDLKRPSQVSFYKDTKRDSL